MLLSYGCRDGPSVSNNICMHIYMHMSMYMNIYIYIYMCVCGQVASFKSQTVKTGNNGAVLTFYYRGKTLSGGALTVDYSMNGGTSWTVLVTVCVYLIIFNCTHC